MMGRNDLGARVRKTAAKTRSHAVARAILIVICALRLEARTAFAKATAGATSMQVSERVSEAFSGGDWRPGLELNQDEGRCPALAYTFRHRAGERAEGIEPPSQPGRPHSAIELRPQR